MTLRCHLTKPHIYVYIYFSFKLKRKIGDYPVYAKFRVCPYDAKHIVKTEDGKIPASSKKM